MRYQVPLAIAAMLSLSSCSMMLSSYERSEMPEIASFNADSLQGSLMSERFWEDFDDPWLNAAIEKALTGNFDVKAAALKVQKARLAADLSESDYLPTPQNSALGIDARRALSYHDSTHKSSSGSFNISYQADLFGQIAAENRVSGEEYIATVYDDRAMRLTVIENTARAYWKYAYCQKALEINRQSLEDSKKRLSLVESRFQAGSANAAELDTARISDLKAQGSVDKAESDLKQARTALMTLLGVGADQDCEVFLPDVTAVKTFPLDVPATLLERRPDLMASEARLRKALANTDVSFTNFFPKITFSAGVSAGSSTAFYDFFANPLSALGAAVTLPFFNFHRLSIERNSALKDYEIAQVDFVSSYIKAVQEVYDYITLIEYDDKILLNSREQYKLASANYDRYFERYRQGLSPLSDLLDAADNKRSAELVACESVRALLSNEISLMTALGGGNPSL